ncbi:PdaC/SigV domain-containing protein [Rummeliibacillus sp. JY-2-4R]
MKKYLVLIISVFTMCLFLSTGISEIKAHSSEPKITIKKYKNNKHYQYAAISGLKYKAANARMLAYTKQVYKDNEKLQQQLKTDIEKGYVPTDMEYWSIVSCEKKYNKKSKVSILCVNYTYTGGAHGLEISKTFNFINGKSTSLKSAFKSEKSYAEGKAYAKNYILKHKDKYPFADQTTTIAGHSFYWTTDGLKVIFEPYEVNAYAYGFQYVTVPSKYLK